MNTTYYDDDLDYDVSLVKLVDDAKFKSVRVLLINNNEGNAAWSGRVECVYIIDLSVPLHFMFRDFARRNSFGKEIDTSLNFKYVYNGENITDKSVKRPIQLGMKDGDKIKIYVEGIPPPVDVNLIDEYGNITTMQARPYVKLNCLFQDYGIQNKMSLLLTLLMYEYRYNGELLSFQGRTVLKDIPNGSIISHITIYVKLVFTLGRVGQIQEWVGGESIYNGKKFKNCESLVKNIPPRKSIGQQVKGVTLGKIVEYIHSGNNVSWIAEFDFNGSKHKKRLSESMFVQVLESYYKTGGVMFDLLEYVQHSHDIYINRMQAIIETNIQLARESAVYARNMALLKVMKLENEMEKTSLIVDWLRKMIIQSELSQMENRLKKLLSTIQKFKTEVKSVTSRVNKPTIQPGDIVYVLSQNESTAVDPTWEKGIIKSSKVYADDIDGYGPRRVYSVGIVFKFHYLDKFDDGELYEDIEDYQVVPEEDYLVSESIKESERKGVRHVCDKDSMDPWAREVGWYTVNIKGIEETFVHLSGALRAYDIQQAQTSDLKESDLNHPKEWTFFFKALAEDGNVDDMMDDLNMELCLLVVDEWISDPNMKKICRAFMYWTRALTHWNGEDQKVFADWKFGQGWKEALGYCLDGNPASAKKSAYIFAIMKESNTAGIGIDQIYRFFISAEGYLDGFLHKVPTFHEAYNASSSTANLTTYLKANRPLKMADEFIFIKCTNGNTTERIAAVCASPFKDFLTNYANDNLTSIKSL